MRARVVRRATGVNDRQLARIPERLERRQPRIESEEAVEVDGGVVGGPRALYGDARTRAIVLIVTDRHNHAEAIHGAPLKDRDEPLRPRGCARRKRRSRQEGWREAETDQRERAV